MCWLCNVRSGQLADRDTAVVLDAGDGVGHADHQGSGEGGQSDGTLDGEPVKHVLEIVGESDEALAVMAARYRMPGT